MAIIKWTPNDMLNDVDRFLDSDWMPVMRSRVMNPAVDIYEDQDHVIVETPIAGVDPQKMSIEIEDNILKISGQSEQKSEIDDKNYYRKEVRYGNFYRAVALPKAVKADGTEATYKDGILKITVPKADQAKPKKITVKVS